MMEQTKLLSAIPQLADRHILVVGDLFLDKYLIGRATRLSREAPIPILEFEAQRQLPGGGANPAMNIVALGGQVTQVGVVGDDQAGHTLITLLQTEGIDTKGIVIDPERPTTTKTRIVAQGSLRFPQQLARIDQIDRRPLSPSIERQVAARVAALSSPTDAVLVSDYRSGLVTSAVIKAVRGTRQGRRLIGRRLICVDTQGRLEQFTGFDLAKCNHHEAQSYLQRTGGQLDQIKDAATFETITARLRDTLGVGTLLITRGAEGLSLQSDGGYFYLPAANRSEVFDVTGAGDTVIAVATLALAAGQTPLLAATLANYAAGLVVRKLGVAAPSPNELAWAIKNWQASTP